MLRTAFNELRQLFSAPGLWLATIIVDLVNLTIDMFHGSAFFIGVDFLLMGVAVVCYINSKAKAR